MWEYWSLVYRIFHFYRVRSLIRMHVLPVLVWFVRLYNRNGRSVRRTMKRDTNDRENFLTLSSVARFELVRNSRCLTLGGANSTEFSGTAGDAKVSISGEGADARKFFESVDTRRHGKRGGNLWKLGYHWLFDSYEWEVVRWLLVFGRYGRVGGVNGA